MADFGILQPMPNFAQAALSGYQAGQQMQQQRRLDQALGAVDLSRPETVMPLLRADPRTGAALLGISEKRAAEDRALERQGKMADVIRQGLGGGQPPEQPTQQAMPQVSAPDAADGITVERRQEQPQQQQNVRSIVADLVAAGGSLEDAEKFMKLTSTMDKAQADKINEQQGAIGQLALIMRDLPMPQRLALIQQERGNLIAHGIPAQVVDTFNPTDSNIQMAITRAVGITKALEFGRQQQQDEEARRHNRVTEGQGAAHVAIAQQNANTQSGALGLAKQKEGRAAKKGTDVGGMSTEELLNMARGK